VELEQEGWFTDPWGRHEARWLSAGKPSKLVRDGGIESFDDPPDAPPRQAWVPIEPPPGSLTSTDTLRADANEADGLPSLGELNRMEDSAALTAQAHPWIVARNWAPWVSRPSTEHGRIVPRAVLIASGVVSGLIVAFSSSLWVVETVALLTSPSTLWDATFFAILFSLVAPVGTYLMWRGDRRAGVPKNHRIQRAVAVSGLLGFLMLVFWVGAHLPADLGLVN
jgi:hypothetical protein